MDADSVNEGRLVGSSLGRFANTVDFVIPDERSEDPESS